MGHQGRQPRVETFSTEGREGTTSLRGDSRDRAVRAGCLQGALQQKVQGWAAGTGEAGTRRISVRVWLGCS